ncbi:glycerate kinase [Leifsonia xyli]|uniref:glycerate kinase n=1 Tax=Leifsonia xyli TaxID=1575 RepID=UPI003D67C43E
MAVWTTPRSSASSRGCRAVPIGDLVLVAPDKFRGSVSAREAAASLGRGIRRTAPFAMVVERPIADGGEGTVDALCAAGFARVELTDTVGSRRDGRRPSVAVRGRVAVIELAELCGLELTPDDERDALRATSRPVGEAIREVLDLGFRHIVLAVGGSASTDGGAGMMRALGLRILDQDRQPVPEGTEYLRDARSIDVSEVDSRIHEAYVLLAADVSNPLLGSDGAAAVFAPQKGADPETVALLESGLRAWAAAVGGPYATAPGAGAAGGVGFAALALLGAERRSGFQLVSEFVGLPELLPQARLVVTGEGKLDIQTLSGKAPAGVASTAARHGVPVVIATGYSELDGRAGSAAGFSAIYALADREPNPIISMRDAPALLERIGGDIARDYLPGLTTSQPMNLHTGPMTRPTPTASERTEPK